uniref:Ubiquitin-like domain-containing protein n=1 Tax=Pavo cristatus TaxID=9049 RepID=A0A8C9FKW2_PAVCR
MQEGVRGVLRAGMGDCRATHGFYQASVRAGRWVRGSWGPSPLGTVGLGASWARGRLSTTLFSPTGEEKRIREFYQSRGLDRVTQPSGEDTVGGDPMGLPYSTFDHSRAHYFRYDEHVSLCLEKQSSSKDKSKAVLQQKYVRCSVRAQIRHLRRVLCHRLGLPLQHVQILFNGEALPDHMTMKQLWLSRWFGKVGVGVGPPPCSEGGEGRGLRPRSREVSSHG